jgi:hypothetical protein
MNKLEQEMQELVMRLLRAGAPPMAVMEALQSTKVRMADSLPYFEAINEAHKAP